MEGLGQTDGGFKMPSGDRFRQVLDWLLVPVTVGAIANSFLTLLLAAVDTFTPFAHWVRADGATLRTVSVAVIVMVTAAIKLAMDGRK
jgi:predicted Na+-dependent transporter